MKTGPPPINTWAAVGGLIALMIDCIVVIERLRTQRRIQPQIVLDCFLRGGSPTHPDRVRAVVVFTPQTLDLALAFRISFKISQRNAMLVERYLFHMRPGSCMTL